VTEEFRNRAKEEKDDVKGEGNLHGQGDLWHGRTDRRFRVSFGTQNSVHFYIRHSPVLNLRKVIAIFLLSLVTMADHYHLTSNDASTSPAAACGWNFIVLMSRQGKIRLSEFFTSYSESEKRRILRDIAADILPRQPKMCNIIEKGSQKFVYRRYASLYFVCGVPNGMNELIVLEQIHLFVEALDGYFNSVVRIENNQSSVFFGIEQLVMESSHLRFASPPSSTVRTRLGLFIAQVTLDSV
jgi:hypothetical protein